MDCPHCGYDVHGLRRPTCPECGSEFDPGALGKDRDPAISRSVVWFSAVSVGWPFVIQAWAHFMLVAARVQLGRWPHRWGMDDPEGIPFVNIMLGVLAAMYLVTVPLMIAGVVGLLSGAVYRRRLTLWLIAAVIASWAAAWLIGDRAEAWVWIMD